MGNEFVSYTGIKQMSCLMAAMLENASHWDFIEKLLSSASKILLRGSIIRFHFPILMASHLWIQLFDSDKI